MSENKILIITNAHDDPADIQKHWQRVGTRLTALALEALAREHLRPFEPEKPWRFRVAADLWDEQMAADGGQAGGIEVFLLFGFPVTRDETLEPGRLLLEGWTVEDAMGLTIGGE